MDAIIVTELNSRREIARSHHENSDGTGYPDGLKGEKIPAWKCMYRNFNFIYGYNSAIYGGDYIHNINTAGVNKDFFAFCIFFDMA